MNYLFADTANLDEIIKANDMGVIQGVTTNPSIIAKEPTGSFDSLIEKLAVTVERGFISECRSFCRRL